MKQKIISNQEYNNIIYLYNNVSIKEIAEQYKVSRSTIENILKDCNVITNRRKSIKIIEDNSQRIIDMYNNGISIKTIAKYFEVDKKTISNHLKNNNVVIQNNQHLGKDCYKINENFFDNFSTPNQAYILGLLYADGYCNSNKNMIRITLQEEDKELLEKYGECEAETVYYEKDYGDGAIAIRRFLAIDVYEERSNSNVRIFQSI